MAEYVDPYVIEKQKNVQTTRGTYSYVVAKPIDSAADIRPVVLMSVEDRNRMSLCNAMEDVVSIIMERENWCRDDEAVWIETSENDPHLGQLVTCPATMPSWGPEKRVTTHLQELQKLEIVVRTSGPDLG